MRQTLTALYLVAGSDWVRAGYVLYAGRNKYAYYRINYALERGREREVESEKMASRKLVTSFKFPNKMTD